MKTIIDDYALIELPEAISISHLVTIHYFEYDKHYCFKGEKHNFWEFLYVDKGEVEVQADARKLTLKQGQLIFHKPNEWHSLSANGTVAPNLIVVSFVSESSALSFFMDKIITADISVKTYLSNLIAEARNLFTSKLSDPSSKLAASKDSQVFASEQMIKLLLEAMLISIIRGEKYKKQKREPLSFTKEVHQEAFQLVTDFLSDHLSKSLSVKDIASSLNLSKSSLQQLVKNNVNMGVSEYFTQLKILESKKLLREADYNFTQISRLLGFSSLHYFSRIFKKTTNMTLTEYTKSIKNIP